MPVSSHKEGELYKIITIHGKAFPIYYGYHSEAERGRWEPTPLFPDFLLNATYTEDGQPYARADQDVCEHYQPKPTESGENWCNDCWHFLLGEDIIGICQCDKRKQIVRQNE